MSVEFIDDANIVHASASFTMESKGLVGTLIQKGIVKTQSQAEHVLLFIIFFIFAIATFIGVREIFYNNSKPITPTERYQIELKIKQVEQSLHQ